MPKGFQNEMLRVGPMCRYAEDVPLLMEVRRNSHLFQLGPTHQYYAVNCSLPCKAGIILATVRIFVIFTAQLFLHSRNRTLQCFGLFIFGVVRHFNNRGLWLFWKFQSSTYELIWSWRQISIVPGIFEYSKPNVSIIRLLFRIAMWKNEKNMPSEAGAAEHELFFIP